MTHYRDMTFCPYWEGCAKGPDCFRSLTDTLRRDAEYYQLPICRFHLQSGCFVSDTDLDSGHDIAHDEQASTECEQGDQSRLPSDGEST